MLPARIALLATEGEIVISCPHIWALEERKAGELYIVKDHANISASSPGIGPNINEYGPRFYDITHMYSTKLNSIFQSLAPLQTTFSDVFWINDSSLPDPRVYVKLASGLSNDRVNFKGIVKSGIAELMAVHHRRA